MGSRIAERLEVDGLVMARWTPDDVDSLAALVARNLEHLRPRMAWVASEPLGHQDRLALLEQWDRDWRAGEAAVFAMILDGQAVGSCGLHPRVGPGGLEIGYWVDADHQGQGLASKAADALTDAAFERDDVAFVVILHDQTNLASRRVPEKLGYREIGPQPCARDQAPADTGVDVVWRVTRPEWERRRSTA
jgi:RimJ/RimL family protein N-acetyltransferase